MSKVAVVTDSVANLPPELVERYSITVIPLLVAFGQKVFRDGVDMTSAQFYRRLREDKHLPTTSTPSMGDFLSLFHRLTREAEAIACIHLAHEFSGTVAIAEEVGQSFKEVPVRVVDSRSAAMAEGFVVLEAARIAAEGADLAAVVVRARGMIPRVNLVVMLDTLKYLYRGGRIGPAARLMGSALQFKPVLSVENGVVDALERPRTWAKAVRRILEIMATRVRGRPVHAAIVHADALDKAEQLRQKVASLFNCRELYVTDLTPVMGTHAGPGVLGVAWWSEEGSANGHT
jgi:DegV family protein with EDD domain